MSMSNTLETELLALLFNADGIANIADNAASGPLTDLSVSLHTGDPGEAGTQATNEASYTSYDRVEVNRAAGVGGWNVVGAVASPVDDIVFPQATGGSETESHMGIGSDPTPPNAGVLYLSGTVTPNIVVSSGVTPRLTASGTTITFD